MPRLATLLIPRVSVLASGSGSTNANISISGGNDSCSVVFLDCLCFTGGFLAGIFLAGIFFKEREASANFKLSTNAVTISGE